MIHFDLPKEKSSIIKVIGIGGGGSNAVNHMFSQGIQGVDFIICNTDSQAITSSPVPNKVQLGPHLTQGLGAGANPQIGKQATEESFEEIKQMLEVNTKMAFITAGMGGGTGTGGAPIIARICKDLGILTVGIITTPFSYEGKKRMQQADEGVEILKQYVDTLLIISNDKLRQQFGNLPFKAAFSKADNILATAAKCITDVINIHGLVNVDFADVCTAMRDGGVAILGSAASEGENRAQQAIENALASPLLNDNSIRGAKWILLNITSSEGEHEHTIDEMDTIQAYVHQQAGADCDVILGMGYDNTLDNKLGVTIIATGFEQKPIALQKKGEEAQREQPKIVMELGKANEEKKMEPQTSLHFEPEEDQMAPRLVQSGAENNEAGSAGARQEPPARPTIQFEPDPVKPEGQKSSNIYASRPASIHVEPARPQGPAASGYTPAPDAQTYPPAAPSAAEPEESAMKLVIREEQSIPAPPESTAPPAGEISATPLSAEPRQETPAPAAPAPAPEAAPSAETNPQPEAEEESEEQKLKAAERIARLRNMSFNVKNMEQPHELETVPAYIRRNVSLDQQAGSRDDTYSSYSVSQEPGKKQAEISTINTFLDGKKPD
ncbi:cell division protein FtsZ [Compostibacter hankyongensis]|uniref:Cell division protein FtsZ n=1 Tax=Compostibacter hankyongensis TaxID=1007089 RepID=A0ABP8FGY0_9BACT